MVIEKISEVAKTTTDKLVRLRKSDVRLLDSTLPYSGNAAVQLSLKET